MVGTISPEEKRFLDGELMRRRRNLAAYEERSAYYGLAIPLELVNGMRLEQDRIAAIEQRLLGGEVVLSLAEQHFLQGTRALITGDLWEARRLFEMVLHEDPFYPHVQERLHEVKRLLMNYISGLQRNNPQEERPGRKVSRKPTCAVAITVVAA